MKPSLAVPKPQGTATPPPSPSPAAGGWLRWLRWRKLALIAGAALLIAAIVATLHNELRGIRFDDVLAAMQRTPVIDIVLALLATAASYLALSGYDASSLRYVGATVKRSTVILTSFAAYALGNTVGLGVLTGGAVRMRLYMTAGLQPPVIMQAIAFNAAAFGLGITAFGALGLLWGASDVAHLLHASPWLLRLLGAAMLGVLAVFLWLCRAHRMLSVAGRWTLRLPPVRLAVRQLAISAVELAASAAALWFLLPAGAASLSSFTAFYAIAVAVALISHVPGGVGIFEAIILLACAGGRASSESVLGALLLYRGIYFLLPLVLATGWLAANELRSGVAAPFGRTAVRLSPRLMAVLTLVAGLWLLFSGVTPASDAAAQLLAMKVPLPIVEASHFLGSVAGLGLLLVARGVLHRLDAAWWAALGLSIIAAILALPKGIALNEAAYLSTLALLLIISRRQFDRRSSLFEQRFETGWLFAVFGVLAACVWVLFFAYQEVHYANRLWWQFEFDGQAPRSLRALMAVALIGFAFSLWQLFRPPTGDVTLPTPEAFEQAAAIARHQPTAEACAVLAGDKHLLFSDSGKSFVMYGKQGRSWVSLFGPIGEPKEWPELVWRFVELAAAHGGRAVFYQVRPQTLPMYLDCGLHAFKLGEHAHVPLPEFSLKGAARADLRAGVNRAERASMSFEVIESGQVAPLLTELRGVSDAWLAQQSAREKGFSVGAFDPDYLQRLPLAVVRKDERIIAFANLMCTDPRIEASVDLMRHRPDAPPGTMDFLFARILLHLQSLGFQRFGLGMAPMAGMAERRRAPRWQRFGRLLFENGERFYNFRGLYSFKEKFEPVWEARYLTAPAGAAPIFALIDIASLIGGGVKGVLGK